MSLIKINWNPGPEKIRQFGGLMLLFAALLSGFFYWRGLAAGFCLIIAAAGAALGVIASAFPTGIGLRVYQSWTAVSFVIGTVVSTLILAAVYYLMITPMAFFMRLRGRDALGLRRSESSYWKPLNIPDDKSYFERLY